MVPAPGEVIDANDTKLIFLRTSAPPDNTQQRIIADGCHEPPREGRVWPSFEHKTKLMHDLLKALGSVARGARVPLSNRSARSAGHTV